MTTYTNHADWIESLAPGSTISGAADLIGVSPSTLTRYLKRNNNTLSADYVIKIAQAHNLDPVRALIDTGKIPDSQPRASAEEKRRLLLELAEHVVEEDD